MLEDRQRQEVVVLVGLHEIKVLCDAVDAFVHDSIGLECDGRGENFKYILQWFNVITCVRIPRG
jgi:hypothetical protein